MRPEPPVAGLQFRGVASFPRFVVFAIAVLLAVAAASGLTLVGCGGGDDDGEGGTETAADEQALLAEDAEAKSGARTAQTALEVYATEQNGSYAGATPEALAEIDPMLTEYEFTIEADRDTYELTVESETGNSFTLARDRTAMVEFTCETPGELGCSTSGDW
jgi:hypothetical protein